MAKKRTPALPTALGPAPKLWTKFLDKLEEAHSVSAACDAIGRDRSTAYEHKGKYPGFSAAWDERVERSTDRLEATLMERALDGYEEVTRVDSSAEG